MYNCTCRYAVYYNDMQCGQVLAFCTNVHVAREIFKVQIDFVTNNWSNQCSHVVCIDVQLDAYTSICPQEYSLVILRVYVYLSILPVQKSAMLKRTGELLEEELGEAKAAAKEAKANEAKWKTAK